MNDTIYVTELLRSLKTSDDPALFNALFTLYVYRYRQVLSNTIDFTPIEKVPYSLQTSENWN